jgi:hypothetical protein
MIDQNKVYNLDELYEKNVFNAEQKEFLKDLKFKYLVSERSVSEPPDDLEGYPIYYIYTVLKVCDSNNKYLGTINITIEIQDEGLLFPPEIKIKSDIDSFPLSSETQDNQTSTTETTKKYILFDKLDNTIKEALSYNELETVKSLAIYDTKDISFQKGYERYWLHLEDYKGNLVGHIEMHFNMNDDCSYSKIPTDIHIEPKSIVLSDSDLIIRELGLEEDKEEYITDYECPDMTVEEIHRLPSCNVEYFSRNFNNHLFCAECKSIIHISHYENIGFTREKGANGMSRGFFTVLCPICGAIKEISEENSLSIYLSKDDNNNTEINPFDTNNPFNNNEDNSFIKDLKPFSSNNPFSSRF